MPEILPSQENIPDPITLQEAIDASKLLDQAVGAHRNGMSEDQRYNYLADTITQTVYQTEVHGTFPGTHDLYLAARVGLFDPTIDDPQKTLDPLRSTGRVSKETLIGIQASIDARVGIKNSGAGPKEMARYETTEASKLLGMIQGAVNTTPRERSIGLAYVGGLFAAHGGDSFNVDKVAEVTGLLQQEAEQPK
jgi:hypothetical protein